MYVARQLDKSFSCKYHAVDLAIINYYGCYSDVLYALIALNHQIQFIDCYLHVHLHAC